jgi:hypothetical protein
MNIAAPETRPDSDEMPRQDTTSRTARIIHGMATALRYFIGIDSSHIHDCRLRRISPGRLSSLMYAPFGYVQSRGA